MKKPICIPEPVISNEVRAKLEKLYEEAKKRVAELEAAKENNCSETEVKLQ